MSDQRLSRQEISTAVSDLGWRFVLGMLRTVVRVPSLATAADVTARVVATAGAHESLRIDVRGERVVLSLQSPTTGWVSEAELATARDISTAVGDAGLATTPEVGEAERSVQVLEIAIDALDIPAVRPFWQAILGYVDEPGYEGPAAGLVDPVGQGPTVWFQQMDAPRPQRNRIHFDISVPHDEAARRIDAVLAAGGTLGHDEAPAFWVLIDPEGNEACVTTWQGRD